MSEQLAHNAADRHPVIEILKMHLRHQAAVARQAAADYEHVITHDLDNDGKLDELAEAFGRAVHQLSSTAYNYRTVRDIQGVG